MYYAAGNVCFRMLLKCCHNDGLFGCSGIVLNISMHTKPFHSQLNSFLKTVLRYWITTVCKLAQEKWATQMTITVRSCPEPWNERQSWSLEHVLRGFLGSQFAGKKPGVLYHRRASTDSHVILVSSGSINFAKRVAWFSWNCKLK